MTEINSGISTSGGNPSSVVERIRQVEKEQVERGEVINTQSATFRFPFLRDERYLTSSNREAIRQLAGAENTVRHAQKVIKDLQIRNPVTITREIPSDNRKGIIIPSMGIGGIALSDKEVKLYFDTDHPNVIESLSSWSGRQIAHELNHIARWQAHKLGKTLLEAMISEGLATYYEEHWNGEYAETKWGHALDPIQIQDEWQQAQHELDSVSYNYRDWFFGIGGNHPVWTGYSLGTAIVRAYFQRHAGAKMAESVRIPSKKILKESGYSYTA